MSANTHSPIGLEWPAPARTRTMIRCESRQARTTTTLLVSAVTRATLTVRRGAGVNVPSALTQC